MADQELRPVYGNMHTLDGEWQAGDQITYRLERVGFDLNSHYLPSELTADIAEDGTVETVSLWASAGGGRNILCIMPDGSTWRFRLEPGDEPISLETLHALHSPPEPAYPQTLFEILTSMLGSELIGWLAAGLSAVLRNVRDKLRERISTQDYDSFSAAVTAAAGKKLVVNSPVTVATNQTIPADVVLSVERGGVITTAAGVTVTINGPLHAGRYPIFAGAGTVAGAPQIDGAFPEWFGAAADGVTDDTEALEKARDFFNSVSLAPGKTYTTRRQINWRKSSEGPKINGNGATIRAIAGTWSDGDAVVFLGSSTTIRGRVRALNIDAAGLVSHGMRAVLLTEVSEIALVDVTGATSYGFAFDKCQIASFNNLRAILNGHGFLFDSCNAAELQMLRGVQNTGNGLVVNGILVDGNGNIISGSGFSGGINISASVMELNGGDGVVVDCGPGQTGPVIIHDMWIERNTGDGIRVESPHCHIYDSRISGNGTGTNRAIRFGAGAGGGSAINNELATSGGNENYVIVDVHADAVSVIDSPNRRFTSGTPKFTTPNPDNLWPINWRWMDEGLALRRLAVGIQSFIDGILLGPGQDLALTDGSISSPDGGIGPLGNLLLYSEQFNSAPWQVGASTVITPDAITSPRATDTADLVTATGATLQANRVFQNVSVVGTVADRTFTASAWIKPIDITEDIELWITNNADGNQMKEVPTFISTEWQRYKVTRTFPSDDTHTGIRLSVRSASAFSCYVWGAQIEERSTMGAYTQTEAAAIAETRGVLSNGMLVAGGSAWDGPHFIMGAWHFWIDNTGALRKKQGAPTAHNDGSLV